MNKSEIIKRISEICGEFDCRVDAVGLSFARTELAKVLAEAEAALAEKEQELAELRENILQIESVSTCLPEDKDLEKHLIFEHDLKLGKGE